jgi:hypothetical protein
MTLEALEIVPSLRAEVEGWRPKEAVSAISRLREQDKSGSKVQGAGEPFLGQARVLTGHLEPRRKKLPHYPLAPLQALVPTDPIR